MNNSNQYDWNLTHLYSSADQWNEDFKTVEADLQLLVNQKPVFLQSGQTLFQFLDQRDQLFIRLMRLYVYAKASFDTDMKDPEHKHLYEKADGVYHKILDQLSFTEPELLTLTIEEYNKYCQDIPELSRYDFMFEKLFSKREHILDTGTEQLLAGMDSLASFFEKAYDDLTVSDIAFPLIQDPDSLEDIKANNTNYYRALLHPERSFRKDFFVTLLGTYQNHASTISSLYYGSVKKNILEAKKRNYNTALEMALKSNYIDQAIYNNLVSTVRNNTDVLHQYLAYRKKSLNYETLHFYDLFVPLAATTDTSYTFEEAKDIILKALAPLGDEYLEIIKKAFAERWLDVFPKENKTSGAYAIGVYAAHPYSLLNFNGTLNDIFTLAHELGHVMHSYYSNLQQPYVNANYTIFCAEVASTVNEQLLYHYLLNHTNDNEQKKYLLNSHLDSIRSTFFRQTLFAEFEKEAHQAAENDEPLTPASLASLYRTLYEDYYGKDFVIDPELLYEWARIPHFYSAFYVYQYATGISAAIAITDNILNSPDYDTSDYLKFLKSGDSDYPVNLLKIAGADMTRPDAIMTTISDFRNTLAQLKNM